MHNFNSFKNITALVSIVFLLAGCAGPGYQRAVTKNTQSSAEPKLLSDNQIPNAPQYVGSIKEEKEAIPLLKVESIYDRPLRVIADVTIAGKPKRAVIILTGGGVFDWNETETAEDQIFYMTFPSDAEWYILTGIRTGKHKQGSWVFVYSDADSREEEFAMPLTELGITPDGKIAVMKFKEAERSLVFYVPGRYQ